MPPRRFLSPHVRAALADPERLRALAATGLVDAPADEGIDRWTEVAAEALDAELATLSVIDAEHQHLKSAVGLGDPTRLERRVSSEHGYCQFVVAGGSPLMVRDAREDPVLDTVVAAGDHGWVAYLGAPIVVSGQPIGSLCVAERRPRAWTPADARLLVRLAEGVAHELELRTVVAQLARSTTLVEAHNRVHEMIAADESIEQVLDGIASGIEQFDPGLVAMILLLDRELGTLHCAAAPNVPVPVAAHAGGPRDGPCVAAALGGEEVVVADVRDDPRTAAVADLLEGHGLRKWWAFPIVRGDGAVIGALGVMGRAPGVPSEEQRRFIQDAVRLAGIAIERRDTVERLVHEATHDALTGLPNRAEAFGRLGAALARSRRSGEPVGVLFVDLDRLKMINDTLGHDVGDRVLEQVGHRLAGAVRPGDTVARCGGEEFVVLAEGIDLRQAELIAERLHAALAPPLSTGPDRELTVTASVGIALVGGEVDAREAIQRADSAMYAAKEEGGNRTRVHAQRTGVASTPRLLVESALRQAIARDELSLLFQPIHGFSDGRMASVEALVRWHHPELGDVPPSEFIPIAEQTDLVHDIGAWVLREACQAAPVLDAAAGRPLRIAVNVSARQLRQRGFGRLVADVLRETGLPAERLVVEITETALLGSDAQTAMTLHRLRDLGVEAVLDDFGTGYSSLLSLKRQDTVAIKIDRSFVEGLPDDAENRAIIVALIGMAHGLGMGVTAEGIETPAQYELLRELGCDAGQGYLLGRPVTADELAAVVTGGA